MVANARKSGRSRSHQVRLGRRFLRKEEEDKERSNSVREGKETGKERKGKPGTNCNPEKGLEELVQRE